MGAATRSVVRFALVDNQDRRFGSWSRYVPALIENEVGDVAPALFTTGQLQEAIERARANPEDAPRPTWLRSLFSRVLP